MAADLKKTQKFIDAWEKNDHDIYKAYSAVTGVKVIDSRFKNLTRVFVRRNPEIKAIVSAHKGKDRSNVEKVLDKYEISETRIAEEIAKLAFSSVTDVLEWDKEGKVSIKSSAELDPRVAGAISEIIPSETGLRIKMFDKKSALELLAKYRGMLVDRKETKSSSVNISFVIDKGDDIKEAVKTIDAEVKELSNAEERKVY